MRAAPMPPDDARIRSYSVTRSAGKLRRELGPGGLLLGRILIDRSPFARHDARSAAARSACDLRAFGGQRIRRRRGVLRRLHQLEQLVFQRVAAPVQRGDLRLQILQLPRRGDRRPSRAGPDRGRPASARCRRRPRAGSAPAPSRAWRASAVSSSPPSSRSRAVSRSISASSGSVRRRTASRSIPLSSSCRSSSRS